MRYYYSLLNNINNASKRIDTHKILKNELFQYLNGQKSISLNNQNIRISNDEERLLCLSMLATFILRQLPRGDLDDAKTEILLQLILDITDSKQQKEFRVIFLDRGDIPFTNEPDLV
ncbi:unnamed protein product [Adineta steineri]|uniref:Uncharacterized protein n=1 Tax=Adineta steineri TaxID=433720 RepID=A0A815I0Z3_9BILA|nr:unnamed protein product [Adineta steineri]CAF1361647.1 unnamed protein product [Adineta steineri]